MEKIKVSKHGAILISTETTRLIRDGEKEGQGIRRWGNIVTNRMTPALRWAAMRAIFMFHNCGGETKSKDSVHKP